MTNALCRRAIRHTYQKGDKKSGRRREEEEDDDQDESLPDCHSNRLELFTGATLEHAFSLRMHTTEPKCRLHECIIVRAARLAHGSSLINLSLILISGAPRYIFNSWILLRPYVIAPFHERGAQSESRM